MKNPLKFHLSEPVLILSRNMMPGNARFEW